MEIRLASPDDADPVAELLLAAFRDYEPWYTPAGFQATTPPAEVIRRRIEEEGPTWVASLDGVPVGTVPATIRESEGYLRSMAVLSRARGRNVATGLLEVVERFAAAAGIGRRVVFPARPP